MGRPPLTGERSRLGLLGRAPSFRRLFLATLGSGLGTWLALVALEVDVFGKTHHSSAWIAALLIADLLPMFAIGMLAGPLMDRAPIPGSQTPVAAIAVPPKARQATPTATTREARQPAIRRPVRALDSFTWEAAAMVSMRSSSGRAALFPLLLKMLPFLVMVVSFIGWPATGRTASASTHG